MSNEDFFKKLANKIKSNENPSDLKPCILGKVVKLNPITVQIECERILLTEGDELIISEWFKFRCKLNKNASGNSSGMDSIISSNIDNITGTCSAQTCNLAAVVTAFKNSINSIKNELLSLKCELQVNDYVLIGSMEETDKYILIDKV